MSTQNLNQGLSSIVMTIYPNGMALIQGRFNLSLKQGANRVQLTGLPDALVVESLYPDTFNGPAGADESGIVTVGSIVHHGRDLSWQTLQARAVASGLPLAIRHAETTHHTAQVLGTLLAYDGRSALVKSGSSVRHLQHVVSIDYPESILAGVSLTSSLFAELTVDKGGEYDATFLFNARNVSWKADHKWILDERNKTLRWDGAIFITNNSGSDYKDAELSVAAGDVALEDSFGGSGAPEGGGGMRLLGARVATAAPKQIRSAEVSSLGQVKLFKIPTLVTIEQGDSQRIPLMLVNSVGIKVEYRVKHQGDWRNRQSVEQDVERVLIFDNTPENKLGQPLPGGRVTVLQRDENGHLRQTGGTTLADTARGETVRAEIGSDFDITAVRTVVSQTVEKAPDEEQPAPEPNQRRATKNYATRVCKVEINNGKDEAIEVVLEEVLSMVDSLIEGHGLEETAPQQFQKIVAVAANTKATVNYTVRTTILTYDK